MSSPTPDRPRRSRDDLLAHVVRRGDHLRLRRRALVATSVAAVGALLVGLPVLLRSPRTRHVVATASTTTVSSVPTEETSTSAVESPSTTVAAPPTTLAHRPSTTTTSLVCRNSTNPACGPFRWDPDPGPNAPLEVHITITPLQPRAGQPMTFTVQVVDPDATPVVAGDEGPGNCNPPGYGEDPVGRCFASCLAPEMYGPWTTPPRQRGERMVTYSHTYAKAGDYTATFYFRSGKGPCGYDPYSNDGDTPVTVHVSP